MLSSTKALVLLVAGVAVAGGRAATHDALTAADDVRASAIAGTTLRTELVEDWSGAAGGGETTGAREAADGAPGGGRQASGRLPAGSIVGRVDVRRAASAPARRPSITSLSSPAPRDVDPVRRTIVYLESAPSGAFDALEPMRGRIDQRNETFVPHVLAVTAGSVVDFPNNDRTYHNVFSLSRTKRFDLGRYPQGASRAVRFDRPGIVRVFCDIHSHMSAFVLVFSHPFFATADADGRYRIDGIPPGRYTVAAWHDGEARATRPVTLPPGGGPADLDLVVP